MAGIGVLCRMKGSLFGSNTSNILCNRTPQVMHQSVLGLAMDSHFKLGVPTKPKKANHFALYIKQTISGLSKEHPNKKHKELFALAAQNYKTISDAERIKLDDLVQRTNKNYRDAMEKYQLVSKDEQALLHAFQAEKEIRKVGRSLKPYYLFKRDRLQAPEIQALSPAEQEEKIAQEWTAAPNKVKKVYKDAYVTEVTKNIKMSYDLIDKDD